MNGHETADVRYRFSWATLTIPAYFLSAYLKARISAPGFGWWSMLSSGSGLVYKETCGLRYDVLDLRIWYACGDEPNKGVNQLTS